MRFKRFLEAFTAPFSRLKRAELAQAYKDPVVLGVEELRDPLLASLSKKTFSDAVKSRTHDEVMNSAHAVAQAAKAKPPGEQEAFVKSELDREVGLKLDLTTKQQVIDGILNAVRGVKKPEQAEPPFLQAGEAS